MWMPESAASGLSGYAHATSRGTDMQDPAHPETIDVFIGVDVGEGQHYAVALDRAGRRVLDRAWPNGAAQRKPLIEGLRSHGTLLFVVDQLE